MDALEFQKWAKEHPLPPIVADAFEMDEVTLTIRIPRALHSITTMMNQTDTESPTITSLIEELLIGRMLKNTDGAALLTAYILAKKKGDLP